MSEIDDLKKFREKYHHARSVCDPLDFAQRQKNLLYAVCEFLLKTLEEIEEKEKQEKSEEKD